MLVLRPGEHVGSHGPTVPMAAASAVVDRSWSEATGMADRFPVVFCWLPNDPDAVPDAIRAAELAMPGDGVAVFLSADATETLTRALFESVAESFSIWYLVAGGVASSSAGAPFISELVEGESEQLLAVASNAIWRLEDLAETLPVVEIKPLMELVGDQDGWIHGLRTSLAAHSAQIGEQQLELAELRAQAGELDIRRREVEQYSVALAEAGATIQAGHDALAAAHADLEAMRRELELTQHELDAELAAARAENVEHSRAIASLQADNAAWRERYSEVVDSLSWTVTGPLRRLGSVVRARALASAASDDQARRRARRGSPR